MPQYQRKQSFVELFCPPEGFHTDFVAMTTFTLSLRLLVQIPLLIACGEKGTRPPRQLGAAVRQKRYAEHCNRFRIYYDASTKAAADDASFYGTAAGRLAQQLLATRCTPVRPTSGLFHPKILLFQFSAPDGRKVFRAHISSRNLTMSQMLEAGVTLETVDTLTAPEQGQANQPAQELADFFRCLQQGDAATAGEQAGLDLNALRGAVFKLCDREKRVDCSLHFGGLNKIGGTAAQPTLLECIENDAQRYSCLRVTSMAPDYTLFRNIKRGTAGQKIIQYVCNFRDLYQQRPDTTLWELNKGAKELLQDAVVAYVCEEKNGCAAADMPCNLHVKEYLFSGGNGTAGVVWIGSANCSGAALQGNNVEVMVRYAVKECPVPDFGNGMFAQNPTRRFKQAIQLVDNPILPHDDPTDRFLAVRMVNASMAQTAGRRAWTLQVTLDNNECVPVTVWLPRLPEQRLAGNTRKTCYFSIDNPTRYSQVLLLQKSEGPVYTLPLNLPWDAQAPSRSELINRVPLDPMESVKELVPALRNEDTATDEAYERILKWVVQSPDNLSEMFAQVLEDCQIRCRELDSLTPGVPENSRALQEALQKRMQELSEVEEDPEDLRRRYESAYSTALFLYQIRQLQRLLEQLLEAGKETADHE